MRGVRFLYRPLPHVSRSYPTVCTPLQSARFGGFPPRFSGKIASMPPSTYRTIHWLTTPAVVFNISAASLLVLPSVRNCTARNRLSCFRHLVLYAIPKSEIILFVALKINILAGVRELLAPNQFFSELLRFERNPFSMRIFLGIRIGFAVYCKRMRTIQKSILTDESY